MAQCDRVGVDEHLLHEEPEDLLSFAHVEGLGARSELGAEPTERRGELDVARVVHGGQLQRVEFRRDGPGVALERRHPLAELGQGDQPFLVSAEEPLAVHVQPRLFALQLCGAGPQGVRGLRRVEPAVDLLADQGGVLQQAQDFGPDQVVQQILADRPVIADGALEMAIAVRSQAAVIVELACTRAGRGAIEPVAACAHRPHPLQQGRLDRAARRMPLVALQLLLGQREGLLAHRRGRGSRSSPAAAVRDWRCSGWPEPSRWRSGRVMRWRGRELGLAIAGPPRVGRVAQQSPDRRALPARRAPSASESDVALSHAGIALMLRPCCVYRAIDQAHDGGLGVDDLV